MTFENMNNWRRHVQYLHASCSPIRKRMSNFFFSPYLVVKFNSERAIFFSRFQTGMRTLWNLKNPGCFSHLLSRMRSGQKLKQRAKFEAKIRTGLFSSAIDQRTSNNIISVSISWLGSPVMLYIRYTHHSVNLKKRFLGVRILDNCMPLAMW